MNQDEQINTIMALNDLAKHVHHNAVVHGWWPEKTDDGPVQLTTDSIAAKLALIHSEVSEALEALRSLDPCEVFYQPSGKPEGMPSELADVVIRVLDLTEALGVNLGARIVEKHEFNVTREHRHGGKRL